MSDTDVKKPHFIIAGVPKAGTTTLFNWLLQHPEVFFPLIKEPEFFVFAGHRRGQERHHPGRLPAYATRWDVYLQLFKDAKPGQKIGEATTHYFHSIQSPGLIRYFLPDVKLIVLLRNPVERMYSHYLMSLNDGFVDCSFQEGLLKGTASPLEYNNKQIGLYAEHLSRYLVFFPSEQIKVALLEDLQQDPAGYYQSLCDFLGIDNQFKPNFDKVNEFGYRKYPWMRRAMFKLPFYDSVRSIIRSFVPFFIRKRLHGIIDARIRTIKPEIPSELREELKAFYMKDILKLQKMLDRDLSHWLV